MTQRSNPEQARGLAFAVSAYLIWGLLPLYLMLLHTVPPLAFVGWRIVFTVPVCLGIVLLSRQGPALAMALMNRKVVLMLMASAALIGGNWLVYVSAIQEGHVYAASLGYYINPLVNVVLGTVLLGERLNRRQAWAVALAAAGILPLAIEAREMLWISLTLAFSFSAYGLVRKVAPVAPLPGLTIESLLLLGPALAVLVWQDWSGLGGHARTTGLVALSGVFTATPLLLFAAAARRMSYTALGFVQFLAPSIVFLLGLFVFHEPLRPVQLASFGAIWLAIVLFSGDLVIQQRTLNRASSAPKSGA